MATRGDHSLEPGDCSSDSMARAAVPQVRPRSLGLTGNTDCLSSAKALCILIPPASLHGLIHLEYCTIPVLIFLLWDERLEVGPHFILLLTLPPDLAVLPWQQHPCLSEGRIPLTLGRRGGGGGGGGGVPGAGGSRILTGLVLLQVRTTHPSVGLRPDDTPSPCGLARATEGAAGAPPTPRGHLAVYHPTVVLEVRATVTHVEAVVVAVAGLVLQVDDDGVDVRLLDQAIRILPITTLLSLPTAPLKGLYVAGQQEGGK